MPRRIKSLSQQRTNKTIALTLEEWAQLKELSDIWGEANVSLLVGRLIKAQHKRLLPAGTK